MNYSNFAVAERYCISRYSFRIVSVLVATAVLLFGGSSFADETRYRVLLESVPGADEIEAGNIRAGVRMLEGQLKEVDPAKSGKIWTTLCAARIISRSLVEAELACNKAVATDPTDYALNNRGVFRVYTGDLAGARDDFERVRPPDVQAYLERLRATDIGLVAAGNFDLVDELMAMRSPAGLQSRRVISTADIEDLSDPDR